MNFERASHQILAVCKRLHARNCLAAADGNVSVRLEDGTIAITPTGRNKAFCSSDEMALISLENKILKGHPSGERLMHLEVYRQCKNAVAVVHAHPPTAIAWSVAKPELKELPNHCLSEVLLAVGSIPIVPYARPGTSVMGENLHPFLPQNRVMILSRHGGLSWGESLDEAYDAMERLEHAAIILKSAMELGGLSSLSQSEIEALKEMRRKMGDRVL